MIGIFPGICIPGFHLPCLRHLHAQLQNLRLGSKRSVSLTYHRSTKSVRIQLALMPQQLDDKLLDLLNVGQGLLSLILLPCLLLQGCQLNQLLSC